ncbi:potassium channel family protein [Cytobacillus sp. FJAT-54145]|uniref:Potassium channel family protein n=1 Tax=Cytobacillus spartinae TaxID=3299023 RepID=A0ABW6KGJ2_9BACI
MFFQRFLKKLLTLNNWLIISSSVVLIFVSTVIMRFIEPETFPTYFDSFWWVMTTVTTVGYGDFYPVSILGRLYAVFLYLFGIGFIGVVIGKVVEGFAQFRLKQEEGKMSYLDKNHVVIIGWSKKAHYALLEILEADSKIEIVLISMLEKTPIQHDRVHFIHGDATDDIILNKANIKYSRSVIIFADDTIKDSQLSDGKSLLIATSIERLAGDLHITVEIQVEKHIELFKHVSVDEFIISDEMISKMAAQSVLARGVTNIYSQLMSRKLGDDLYQIPTNPKWTTYRDAFHDLLEQGATLISNGENLNINRRLDEAIDVHSKLYIICNEETYKKIVGNEH